MARIQTIASCRIGYETGQAAAAEIVVQYVNVNLQSNNQFLFISK